MAQALLGCIADDFTGATDLANMLVRGGMRTVQTIGVPDTPTAQIEADALVVALSRARFLAAKRCAVARRARVVARSRAAGSSTSNIARRSTPPIRQYRPGRGCVARCAEGRFHHRLPGVSGERPHDLSRQSVRRRRAAERIRHGESSAHADDRLQSRARAAAADQVARSD